jgi:hypothetical protein
MEKEAAVEFRVKETRGIARHREPVTVGVPLPPGAVPDASALSIEGPGGDVIAAQTLVTDRRADGRALGPPRPAVRGRNANATYASAFGNRSG